MPETATTKDFVRVLKTVGSFVGASLGMIAMLTFFFAPIQADLETLKEEMASTKAKLEQITLKQLTLEADIEAHGEVGHSTTIDRLGEVRDQVIELRGEVARSASDITAIQNRQQTIIDQMADVKAVVNNAKR